MVSQIKVLCAKHNTNLKALERELGLGNGTIRRWDDSSPAYSKIQKVADYFGVTVAELTGEEQQEKPTPLKSGELEESRKKMIDFALTADIKKVELMASVLETVGK